MVPLVSVGAGVIGLSAAPAAGADCESRNGTMLCTDGSPQTRSSEGEGSYSYPCEFDWYCDDFGLDIVLDNDRPAANPPSPNNDLPRPDRPNRPNRPRN